eukprot:Phypoly_transcript_13538.p1 GENE.Phypoly_transcript_13538~~Phypoly_transcript_13538.p1  ORF type:complete len:334 (+),score=39.96 Phypoly_transcript_13538:69-1004(+)
MTIGDQLDDEGSKQVLEYFFSQGYHQLDTAIMYAGGKTEVVLGKVLSTKQKSDSYIASKVNNFTEPDKALTRQSIFSQVDTILKNLQVDHIDLLYLHWPDRKTPLEETLNAVNDIHKQGKFKHFGLSNFAAWEVANVWHLCNQHGWVKPTVYQGMYNAITRDVESELIPALRSFNIKFYIYNPLAGGLLTGKHSFANGGSELEGRFKNGGASYQNRYINRYWKPDIFEALEDLKKACAAHGISMTEASLRWVRHHSKLIPGDAIIIGASKMEHLKENIKFGQSTDKLPEDIVKAFDAAWIKTKPVCEQYWR